MARKTECPQRQQQAELKWLLRQAVGVVEYSTCCFRNCRANAKAKPSRTSPSRFRPIVQHRGYSQNIFIRSACSARLRSKAEL